MSDSVSFRATRMVYGDNNQPQGFEIYTYDSDQDLITVFNVDRDGMLTGSHVDDSLSISESLGIRINPVNDAPIAEGFLRPLRPGNENTDYQIELSDLINNISDVDNDEEAFNVVNLIVRITLKDLSPNDPNDSTAGWIFTPSENFNGTVELNYQVTDSTGLFVQDEAGNPQESRCFLLDSWHE